MADLGEFEGLVMPSNDLAINKAKNKVRKLSSYKATKLSKPNQNLWVSRLPA